MSSPIDPDPDPDPNPAPRGPRARSSIQDKGDEGRQVERGAGAVKDQHAASHRTDDAAFTRSRRGSIGCQVDAGVLTLTVSGRRLGAEEVPGSIIALRGLTAVLCLLARRRSRVRLQLYAV